MVMGKCLFVLQSSSFQPSQNRQIQDAAGDPKMSMSTGSSLDRVCSLLVPPQVQPKAVEVQREHPIFLDTPSELQGIMNSMKSL